MQTPKPIDLMPGSSSKLQLRCPVRTTMELLGGKWKLLIIHQLGENTLRFRDLKKSVPDITEKMLVQELKTLCDSDLVERINWGEVPPRVDYKLTLKGLKVLPLIEHIKDFGMEYMANS
jgi:DNA-binding HxlR family transcriptional regulator